MARKLLVLLLILGLAPGLWWRSQAPPPSECPRLGQSGPIRLERLNTDDPDRKWLSDIEALTRDPDTGTLWAAFEGRNIVVRYGPDLVATGDAEPPQIRHWSFNSGLEAMERLSDGRFLMLSEGATDGFWGRHEGVLFAGDPVEGATGTEFNFVAPEGYSPVDLAQIPDGRMLVLLRRVMWTLPLTFDVALMLADPADIADGGEWHGQIIAHFGEIVPNGNYEGLAVEPGEDGTLSLWVIADDNVSRLQETYLLHFAWDPRAPV
jgi:hypothetical protein